MGLFDPPSVKALRKEAEDLGGLFGLVHRGDLAAAHLEELIDSASHRARLRELFERASADVGEQKALKAARRGANLGADASARLGRGPYRHVLDRAEATVQEMVGR